MLSSLLFQACDEVLTDSPDQHPDIAAIRDRAEAAILARDRGRLGSDQITDCDVVVLCDDVDATNLIDRVLAQTDVVVVLHLGFTEKSKNIARAYQGRWNVRLHQLTGSGSGISSLEFAHQIVAELETSHLAVASSTFFHAANKLQDVVSQLEKVGGDLYVSAAHQALVMQRGTFVDMGGVADDSPNNEEFVYRAHSECRVIVRDDNTPPAEYDGKSYPRIEVGRLDRLARNFPGEPVACDVVLPFYGQLEFVSNALESILAQVGADVVVHLIDDASPTCTESFLSEWKDHHQIRIYRNRENIGQFASFNNVSQFFETDLVAVQDGDDISLPHRIHLAGNLLRLSGADYFGGATELFGSDTVPAPTFVALEETAREQRSDFHRSQYPKRDHIGYFIENPTAVFRVAMFRRMGGYANFGNRLANRASLDTEFLMRCRFSNVRFAVSREIVTRQRVHENSATQNAESGWGTEARTFASEQVTRRSAQFRRSRFDPRVYGAINYRNDITRRIYE